MSACIGTPISWLRLESYHLGEFEVGERAAIEAHLKACEVCAACLREIESDRTLPPLTLPAASSVATNVRPRVVRWIPVLAPIAAAAVVVLLLRGRDEPVRVAEEPRVKGGEVVLSLVRDDGVRFDRALGAFHDGDRFHAVVTCPPELRATWDLVVFERGQKAAFPLPPSEVRCGNDASFPGAFALGGRERETICIVWGEGGTDRELAARLGPEGLPPAQCVSVDPAD